MKCFLSRFSLNIVLTRKSFQLFKLGFVFCQTDQTEREKEQFSFSSSYCLFLWDIARVPVWGVEGWKLLPVLGRLLSIWYTLFRCLRFSAVGSVSTLCRVSAFPWQQLNQPLLHLAHSIHLLRHRYLYPTFGQVPCGFIRLS